MLEDATGGKSLGALKTVLRDPNAPESKPAAPLDLSPPPSPEMEPITNGSSAAHDDGQQGEEEPITNGGNYWALDIFLTHLLPTSRFTSRARLRRAAINFHLFDPRTFKITSYLLCQPD